MKRTNKEKGFTLVEIIVVLVIIAILAAILVPSLLGYIDKAREKQYVIHAKSALTAAQSVASELYAKGSAPTEISQEKYKNEIATIADLAAMDCEELKIGFKASYKSDLTANPLSTQHDAYTVFYIIYKENGVSFYFDGNSWTESSGNSDTCPITIY